MHNDAIRVMSRLIRIVTSRFDEGSSSTTNTERSIGYAKAEYSHQYTHSPSDTENRRTHKELAIDRMGIGRGGALVFMGLPYYATAKDVLCGRALHRGPRLDRCRTSLTL